MKFCILIASRGNPAGLGAVVGAMAQLATGDHAVEFRIAIDDDDLESFPEVERLGKRYNVVPYYGKRPEGLGSPYNVMAQENNESIDCFISMTDRTIPLTPKWDDLLASTLKDGHDNCILWWHSDFGNQMTLPIIPMKWYRAAGMVYPARFPFWFEDTWLVELNAMVHGLPHKSTKLAFYMSRNRKTKRCRDMRFWMDYFIAMGAQRMLHAEKIRENLGLPPLPVANAVQEERKARYEMWAEKCEQFQVAYGDPSEPEMSYKKAYDAALKEMNPPILVNMSFPEPGDDPLNTFRYLDLPL